MDWLFGWLTDWIKEGLIDAITGQYTGIFESVNDQVTDVAAQVGQTPQGWNGGVFSMIQTLSENVVLPIAGIILTFVLVYELIQMILEKIICTILIPLISLSGYLKRLLPSTFLRTALRL